VLFVTWTNVWIFPEIVASWRTHIYFDDRVTVARAVDELFSFPHGRYSSFFFFVLPGTIGLACALLWWGSLIFSTISSWTLRVYGIGTALCLLLALNLTLDRGSFGFTPYTIFFIFCTVSFLKLLAAK